MTSTVCFLAAVLGVTAAAPQAAPSKATQWQSDYGKALQQTRADDRPLLMVIDNPANADESVSPELLGATDSLQAYDLCHVDVSTPYGKKVAKAFKTQQLPHVAFIDKRGSVILHSHSGAVTGDKWNGMVSKYVKGVKPLRRFAAKPVAVSTPVQNQDYGQYIEQYSPKPYCAKCQRGY